MRRILPIFIAIFIVTAWSLTAFGETKKLEPGNYERSVKVGSLVRTFLVHVPAASLGEDKLPLVFAFHGALGNGLFMKNTTDLYAVSNKYGFVVVYPNGTGTTKKFLMWNSGNCCGYAQKNNVDDVAFVKAMIADLSSVLKIDPKRIYATGISNGAMLSYRLACEMSDQIAAIAPISGTMNVPSCTPKRPVPVMHFHGTDDKVVLYDGGVGPESITKTAYKSVDQTLSEWRTFDNCPTEGTKTQFHDKDRGATTVYKTVWKCPGNSDVVSIKVVGGGHTWPGARAKSWGKFGKVTQDISAGEQMWNFFASHPLP